MSLIGRIACALGAHDHPEPWEADEADRWRNRVFAVREGRAYSVRERFCRRCGWHAAPSFSGLWWESAPLDGGDGAGPDATPRRREGA
jgi:hypothetical protein